MAVEILRKTALDDRVKTKNNVRIVFESPEKAKPGVGHVHSFLSTDRGRKSFHPKGLSV